MGEDSSSVKDVIEAATGLVQAVPVYQDLLQPAAKQIGTALETVAKTLNVALAPVSALVWGYDQVKVFVDTKVADRLKNVPPENIITPKPNVAGPLLESLRYTGHESSLSDLYANLLAASMDKDTASGAHPAFVEIIRQLTPDEAKLVGLFVLDSPRPVITVGWKYKNYTKEQSGGQSVLTNFSLLGQFVGAEFPELTPTYINNLCRLGLAEVPVGVEYTSPGVYDEVENSAEILALKAKIELDPTRSYASKRLAFMVTPLGKQFAEICVQRKP